MNNQPHPRERKGWQRLAVPGPLYYAGRHTELTMEDLEAVRRNMVRDVVVNNEKLLIDYEHESEEKSGRVPAAGWIRHPQAEVHPDGLWAFVEWTDIGKEDVEKERVKYFSPVIIKNARHKKTGEPIGAYLKSATLTNIPHIDELQIAASEHPAPEGGDHEEVIVLSMEINREQSGHKEKGMQKEIAKQFGLPEGASEAEIIEASGKFITEANANKKRLEEITAAAGTPPDKIVASMKELKAKAEKNAESKDAEILTLSEKIAELEKKDEKREKEISDLQKINKENEIELLLHEGKIDPSEREEYIALREEAPKFFARKIAKLKPKNRDKMPVNVQTVNGEETIVASEGLDADSESMKRERQIRAYAQKHNISYQRASEEMRKSHGRTIQ